MKIDPYTDIFVDLGYVVDKYLVSDVFEFDVLWESLIDLCLIPVI